MATLKVEQKRSDDRLQEEPARHRCARWVSSGSATSSSRRTARRSGAWSRPSVTSVIESRRLTDMTLKLHHLRPAPGAKTAKTRVGRGEGSKGKTAGRGTKGTKARYQVPAAFEGGQMPIHMRLPKLKGFKNPFKVEFQVVNLDRISDAVPRGRHRDRRGPGRQGCGPQGPAGQGARPGRHLGRRPGDRATKFSGSAKEKIAAAGGHRHRELTDEDSTGSPTGQDDILAVLGGDRSCPVGFHGLGPRRGPRRSTDPGHTRPRPAKEEHVLGAFANAFRTPDLRKKLLFVLLIIALFRLGSQIPTPGVNVANVQALLRRRPRTAASTA